MQSLSPSDLRDLLKSASSPNSVSGIYYILNAATGQCYIGSSINIRERLRQHCSYLIHNRHHSKKLQNAFNKYSWESFVWGVCEEVLDHSKLEAVEQGWINLLGEYNICKEAGSPRGVKMTLSDAERDRRRERARDMYSAMTPEQREANRSKATEARRGVPTSDEMKARLSASTSGRKLSEAHRAKLSHINKTRVRTAEEKALTAEKVKATKANKSPEDVAKWKMAISEAKTGIPSPKKGTKMSEESRAKMSASGKGKVISASQREKLSAAMKAKPKEWYELRGLKIKEANRLKRAKMETAP